ncbi:hypothetical protein [Roseovarius nanhaiticus]|uniref:hypothetical protein n=1 Tax=Roseovarius nanhaiticus TaxID=573024 RepID=UPI002491AAE6|nr:hypothetical protein [Roseovarius nanhaiticus]
MSLIIGLLGVVCLIVTMTDFLITTVGTNDSSPIAIRIAKVSFRLFRQLPEADIKHKVIGPLVVASVATWWILSVNLAWAMIFYGISGSVVEQGSGRAADPVGFVSHVGHLLSTVGGGATSPANSNVALLGVVVGVNGMIVLTLAVSFVMTTTQTVVHGRKLLLYLGADRDNDMPLLKDMAGLIAELNAAPFALFFSHEDPEMRVPEKLTEIFGRRFDDAAVDWEHLAQALPYLHRYPEADMRSRLQDWLRDFSASRRPAPE